MHEPPALLILIDGENVPLIFGQSEITPQAFVPVEFVVGNEFMSDEIFGFGP